MKAGHTGTPTFLNSVHTRSSGEREAEAPAVFTDSNSEQGRESMWMSFQDLVRVTMQSLAHHTIQHTIEGGGQTSIVVIPVHVKDLLSLLRENARQDTFLRRLKRRKGT